MYTHPLWGVATTDARDDALVSFQYGDGTQAWSDHAVPEEYLKSTFSADTEKTNFDMSSITPSRARADTDEMFALFQEIKLEDDYSDGMEYYPSPLHSDEINEQKLYQKLIETLTLTDPFRDKIGPTLFKKNENPSSLPHVSSGDSTKKDMFNLSTETLKTADRTDIPHIEVRHPEFVNQIDPTLFSLFRAVSEPRNFIRKKSSLLLASVVEEKPCSFSSISIPQEISDLSACDGTIFCVEYVQPVLALQTVVGMCSGIRNYVNTVDSQSFYKGGTYVVTDAHKPPYGVPIEPGKPVRSIETTMYRCPTVEYEKNDEYEDFLLIRNSKRSKGYVLRKIDSTFIAGKQRLFRSLPNKWKEIEALNQKIFHTSLTEAFRKTDSVDESIFEQQFLGILPNKQRLKKMGVNKKGKIYEKTTEFEELIATPEEECHFLSIHKCAASLTRLGFERIDSTIFLRPLKIIKKAIPSCRAFSNQNFTNALKSVEELLIDRAVWIFDSADTEIEKYEKILHESTKRAVKTDDMRKFNKIKMCSDASKIGIANPTKFERWALITEIAAKYMELKKTGFFNTEYEKYLKVGLTTQEKREKIKQQKIRKFNDEIGFLSGNDTIDVQRQMYNFKSEGKDRLSGLKQGQDDTDDYTDDETDDEKGDDDSSESSEDSEDSELSELSFSEEISVPMSRKDDKMTERRKRQKKVNDEPPISFVFDKTKYSIPKSIGSSIRNRLNVRKTELGPLCEARKELNYLKTVKKNARNHKVMLPNLEPSKSHDEQVAEPKNTAVRKGLEERYSTSRSAISGSATRPSAVEVLRKNQSEQNSSERQKIPLREKSISASVTKRSMVRRDMVKILNERISNLLSELASKRRFKELMDLRLPFQFSELRRRARNQFYFSTAQFEEDFEIFYSQCYHSLPLEKRSCSELFYDCVKTAASKFLKERVSIKHKRKIIEMHSSPLYVVRLSVEPRRKRAVLPCNQKEICEDQLGAFIFCVKFYPKLDAQESEQTALSPKGECANSSSFVPSSHTAESSDVRKSTVRKAHFIVDQNPTKKLKEMHPPSESHFIYNAERL